MLHALSSKSAKAVLHPCYTAFFTRQKRVLAQLHLRKPQQLRHTTQPQNEGDHIQQLQPIIYELQEGHFLKDSLLRKQLAPHVLRQARCQACIVLQAPLVADRLPESRCERPQTYFCLLSNCEQKKAAEIRTFNQSLQIGCENHRKTVTRVT